jgi:hypothetical protein
LEAVRLGYADPPYIGCAHLYSDHEDYAGEVDHFALIERLESEFDGWVLHAAATVRSYGVIIPLVEKIEGVRICQWVKSFAAYKANVSVAYASEPVFIKAARKPVVSKRQVMRDFIETEAVKESITLRRGLTGAKPERVCHWAFELLGARPEDELSDLFPGTGAVTRAWLAWRGLFALPKDEAA